MRRVIQDEVYMTFDKYFELRNKFGTNRNYNYETVSLDGILKASNIDESIKTTYKSAFSELLRHIHHSIITYHGDTKGCWYISYILHKEVYEKLSREYTSDLFRDFKEFLLKYNRHFSKDLSLCLNDMLYVKQETYEIMDELYRLYDVYIDKYKPYNKNVHKDNCSAFRAFLHSYNTFISTNESGTNFFNGVLKNFHKQIKDAVSTYEDKCTGITYNVGKLHLYDPPPPTPVVVQPEVKQENQSALVVNGLQDSRQEVANHSDESRTQEVAASVSTHDPEKTHNTETTLYPERSHDRVTEMDPLTRDHQDRIHGYGREQENVRRTVSGYPQHLATIGSLTELGYSDKTPFAQNLEGQNQDDGFISNVKNTLSGIVQSVEPAPILGVSGGMGVLFLLFKYTPVGSFFGGRRGRFHQIPSSFRGFPPGEFPNFHEYEGGHIGYVPMGISPFAE